MNKSKKGVVSPNPGRHVRGCVIHLSIKEDSPQTIETEGLIIGDTHSLAHLLATIISGNDRFFIILEEAVRLVEKIKRPSEDTGEKKKRRKN